jgi:endoglucanase
MTTRSFSLSRRRMLHGTAAAAIATGAALSDRALAQSTLAGRDVMSDKRPIIHQDGPKFGAYDPHGDFREESGIATEHLFLPWVDVDLSSLPAADDYALARNRKILVTIEPWSWAKDWNITPSALRRDILAGRYDSNMRAILRALSNFKSPLIIRWAQEMDSSIGRFIWQNWHPKDYIQAYVRMSDITRTMLPEAQVMWSPKGEKNLVNYYPGDEYVDLVGLSVFGLEAYDKIEFGGDRNYADAVRQGYGLAVGFKKPIWVAELGYEGDPTYVSQWIQDVTRSYPQYPEIKEVIYFNDREVWEWPHNLGLPNWRVVRDAPTYSARPR